VRWSLRSKAAGLWLRKKRSGEHGPGKPERGRANQRVSRVADGKAELIEATDGAWARRRSHNRRQSMVGGGGVLWSRAQSKREGEKVHLRVQVSGGRWYLGGDSGRVPSEKRRQSPSPTCCPAPTRFLVKLRQQSCGSGRHLKLSTSASVTGAPN
jgi:hypothetical protein